MGRITPEIRKINNDDDSCWKRFNKNGSIEYFNKDYYNPNYTRKDNNKEKLSLELIRIEIEKELNNI